MQSRVWIFLFAIIVFPLSQVSAQFFKIEKIDYGVKAGLNVSGLDLVSPNSNTNNKLSGAKYHSRVDFHLGGYATLKFKKKLALQPELLFSRQGQLYSTSRYSNLRTRLSYINIPVLIKYYPTKWLNVYAGPQVGFLVGAKGDMVPSNNVGGVATMLSDVKQYMNVIDFSLTGGLGLEFPKGISASVRYNFGFSDINKFKGGSTTPSFSTARTLNQVIQISLGYKLNQAKKKD